MKILEHRTLLHASDVGYTFEKWRKIRMKLEFPLFVTSLQVIRPFKTYKLFTPEKR